MSVEQPYRYDEPLGIYGHESQQRLARGVMQDLIRYEEIQLISRPPSDIPSTIERPVCTEEFRISSMVESHGTRLGYALALAPLDQADRATMGGIFYTVDRYDPAVIDHKELIVARPETFRSNKDYQSEVEGLMHRFDKSELEAMMRMIGKMTTSQELAGKLLEIDELELSSFKVTAMHAESMRIREILKRTAPVEPFVMSALHNHSQRDLGVLFPKNRPFNHNQHPRPQTEHILEWQEFMSTAEALITRETHPDQPLTYVNIRHEQDDRSYYIRLAAKDGQLLGAQILCDSISVWKAQQFNLSAADTEAQADLNRINAMWDEDRAKIIESLRDGQVICDEDYESYRLLAVTSILDDREATAEPVHLELLQEKRSVA